MTNQLDEMQQIIQRVLEHCAGTFETFQGEQVTVGGIGTRNIAERIAQALREAGYVKVRDSKGAL